MGGLGLMCSRDEGESSVVQEAIDKSLSGMGLWSWAWEMFKLMGEGGEAGLICG